MKGVTSDLGQCTFCVPGYEIASDSEAARCVAGYPWQGQCLDEGTRQGGGQGALLAPGSRYIPGVGRHGMESMDVVESRKSHWFQCKCWEQL
eukprot:400094-Pelagomonas_calceolata.AAC.1